MFTRCECVSSRPTEEVPSESMSRKVHSQRALVCDMSWMNRGLFSPSTFQTKPESLAIL